MSRSLYRRLGGVFAAGSPGSRRPLAHGKLRELEERVEFRAFPFRRVSASPNGLSVTVVGGGFAGLMAAASLADVGFSVTVLEARSEVGGRVSSRTDICSGRVIEAGAELIGSNHPLWINLASEFSLGLSVLTPEDQFTAAQLEMPLYLRGRLVPDNEANEIYDGMTDAFRRISDDAALLDNPYAPWEDRNAAKWDDTSVATMLEYFHVDHDSLLWDALVVELVNNQTATLEHQSYLGLLAVVRGGELNGDPMAFWTRSEVFRCARGNQSLAQALQAMLEDGSPGSVQTGRAATAIAVEDDHVDVTTSDGSTRTSDYVVLAIPQPTWPRIAFSPPIPDTYLISTGPAVKYLSPVDSRFWLSRGQAPYGMSDDVGMTWEGTDNQMVVGDQGVELSLFAGGPWAEAALQAPDPSAYFDPRIDAMLPGFRDHAAGLGNFMAWPRDQWTRCGYSCPDLGEVTTAGPLLAKPFAGRMAFAGEHTVMAMFGYMEGALESGVIAARTIVGAAGLDTDPR